MKICTECGKEYTKCSEASTLYCSIECRKAKRNRLQKEKRIEIRQYPEKYLKTIIDRIYKTYKSSAFRHGRKFELVKEDMYLFYQKDCYYCGDNMKTVGIDRIDNNLGYTKTNTVPCCKYCNWMKNSHGADEFIEHCRKIVNNHSI